MRTAQLVPLGEVLSPREVTIIAGAYAEADWSTPPLAAIAYDHTRRSSVFLWHPAPPLVVEYWILKCQWCDGLFASTMRPSARLRFCSDRCRVRAQRGQLPTGPVVCAHCGKPIEGHLSRRYCSSACRQAAYRARARLKDKLMANAARLATRPKGG